MKLGKGSVSSPKGKSFPNIYEGKGGRWVIFDLKNIIVNVLAFNRNGNFGHEFPETIAMYFPAVWIFFENSSILKKAGFPKRKVNI